MKCDKCGIENSREFLTEDLDGKLICEMCLDKVFKPVLGEDGFHPVFVSQEEPQIISRCQPECSDCNKVKALEQKLAFSIEIIDKYLAGEAGFNEMEEARKVLKQMDEVE